VSNGIYFRYHIFFENFFSDPVSHYFPLTSCAVFLKEECFLGGSNKRHNLSDLLDMEFIPILLLEDE
jgi:hypothetical protein